MSMLSEIERLHITSQFQVKKHTDTMIDEKEVSKRLQVSVWECRMATKEMAKVTELPRGVIVSIVRRSLR